MQGTKNLASFHFTGCSSLRADEEEEHGEKDKSEVEEFGPEVLLVEEHSTTEEGDDHATPSDHADDANHSFVLTEGVEIDEIGCREEDRDEDDAPIPMEGRGLLAMGIPEHQQHDEHHEELIDVVPRLDGHLVEPYACGGWSHEVTVVESAHGSEHIGEDNEGYPFVVTEIDTFLLPTATHEVEGDDGDSDSHPLPYIEVLAQKREGSDEHHDGTGGVDGTYDGDGEVLHTEIAAEPRAEHDDGLE